MSALAGLDVGQHGQFARIALVPVLLLRLLGGRPLHRFSSWRGRPSLWPPLWLLQPPLHPCQRGLLSVARLAP
eukprot:7648141-Pyramimonas_sp.AAC.1